MRLLVVEDNDRLGRYLSQALHAKGYTVDHLTTARDTEAAIGSIAYTAIILDLGLPDMDGMALLKKLRQDGHKIPVLILTARDSTKDLVEGLDDGADDYLRKPFEIDELIARIRALLRRPGHLQGRVITEGNIEFDTIGREARIDGIALKLPRRELDALELLLRRSGKVVPKATFETMLYSFDNEATPNAVEVLVHRLRKRMQDAGADNVIHTIRGVGYMLMAKCLKTHDRTL